MADLLNLNARGLAALTPLTVTCARPGCNSRFTFTVGDADDLRTVSALAGWYTERRGSSGPAARLILDFCPDCKPGRDVLTGMSYTLNLNARGCTTLKPLTIGCDAPGCRNRFTFTVGDFDDLRAAASLAGWHCERGGTPDIGGREVVDHCPACKSAAPQRSDGPLSCAPEVGGHTAGDTAGDTAADTAADRAAAAVPATPAELTDQPLGREPARPVVISMADATPAATPADGNGQLPT
jgi:hypothetical protein